MSVSMYHGCPVGYLLLDLQQRVHGSLGQDDAFHLAADAGSARTVLIRNSDGYITVAYILACLTAEITTYESIHGTCAGVY